MNLKNKGGRPKSNTCKNEKLSLRTDKVDKKLIENKAIKANMTVSEYLRLQGLNGEVKIKDLPKEIIKIICNLNQISSNLNQISRQLNRMSFLSTSENLKLLKLIEDIQKIVMLLREEFKYDR